MEDIQTIMSEAPGDITPVERVPEGFGVVDTLHTAADAGMVAHRGVLSPGEYVDSFALRAAVEAELGFSHADVSAAYKGGRPTAERRQLRVEIDARLLALSRSGGNMTELGKALDLGHATIERAIARAKAVEVVPIVKHPAVRTRCVSFMTGEPGARPRRRRFSKSPAEYVGTINLNAEEYTRGFEDEPGSREYWAFRKRGR